MPSWTLIYTMRFIIDTSLGLNWMWKVKFISPHFATQTKRESLFREQRVGARSWGDASVDVVWWCTDIPVPVFMWSATPRIIHVQSADESMAMRSSFSGIMPTSSEHDAFLIGLARFQIPWPGLLVCGDMGSPLELCRSRNTGSSYNTNLTLK